MASVQMIVASIKEAQRQLPDGDAHKLNVVCVVDGREVSGQLTKENLSQGYLVIKMTQGPGLLKMPLYVDISRISIFQAITPQGVTS